MPEIDGKEVVYVKDVIVQVQEKLSRAAGAAQKVLPGARAKLIVPLQEASTLLRSVEEVLRRSGMDKRLGFVQSPQGMQPVIQPEAVETPDTEASDGA